jgi:hypothetical protein
MNLIRCDFCGRISNTRMNKLVLDGLCLKENLKIEADVCHDCAKGLYSKIDIYKKSLSTVKQ